MLSIKLVALRHQKVPLIFDSVTSLPLLYPLLFSQSKLFTKAFNTQLASLQAVKSFYDFWSSKYHCSFCFSFWQAKTYPLIAIQEMENFSIFLKEGSLSNIYRENLKEISSITTATRVRAVLQFIVYLNDEFVSSRYIDLSHTEVIAMHNYLSKMINLKRQDLCQFSKSNLRKNNSHQPYSSLNSNMVKDLFSMLLPSTLKQVNANNPFKKIETQFRNYLIFRLLINYGLRIGELLLLQTDSVKRTSRGSYALVITNSEDYDERIHAPSIKTKDSHRILELDVFDYRLIRTYVDEIRHSINSSPVLFTTISPPYKPLDYQAIRFACETISNKFKDLYPYHFDKSQLDSITSINLHMCRHVNIP
jgi:integrase